MRETSLVESIQLKYSYKPSNRSQHFFIPSFRLYPYLSGAAGVLIWTNCDGVCNISGNEARTKPWVKSASETTQTHSVPKQYWFVT